MYVVIFKAEIKLVNSEYVKQAKRMRDLALQHYGCIKVDSVMEGNVEITLSYWQSKEDISAWKNNNEHKAAQDDGINKWYRSYNIEVVEVVRSYQNES